MESTAARPVPWRAAVLAAAVTIPAIAVATMRAVIRGGDFHRYADQRTVLGIPHFGDVVSNLPFVVVGLAGLVAARTTRGLPRGVVALLFASVIAIGLGSGTYHWFPRDVTLFFDWLPIALTATLMVALLVHDRIDAGLGWAATVALPVAAAASVAWWWWTMDARWYGLVQLTSIGLVPLILVLYPKGRLDRGWLLAGVGCFLLARLVHTRDHQLLDATRVISGHAAKHLLAAAATWCVLRALPRE